MSPSTVRIGNLTGLQGGTVISDTNPHAAPSQSSFHALLVVQQAVINTVTGNLGNVAALQGISLPPGMVIYGRFQSVKLTSGLIVAYNE